MDVKCRLFFVSSATQSLHDTDDPSVRDPEQYDDEEYDEDGGGDTTR